MARITAVIDFGSNSVRLVLFQRTSRFGFKVIHESKQRVRIGEGAYHNGGVLQEKPMERAILALLGFKSIMNSFKVRKVLAIATSALRDAPNRNIFLNRVRKEVGINLKVIDGKKEALLGGIASANLLHLSKGVTVDIGGGSTEFALFENRRVLDTFSLNLGTVRLKELFSQNSDIEGARKHIRQELENLPKEFRYPTLVAIGGTLRALAKVIQKRNSYPIDRLHGYRYSYPIERDFINSTIYSSNSELLEMGIKQNRLDVIRWGVLIFQEIAELFEVDEVVTSGVGIREGIFLFDILRSSGRRFPTNFNPSIRNILDEFQVDDIKVIKHAVRTANTLFDILQPHLNLDSKFRQLITYSAKLLEIGIKVNFYENSKNGFYLIINRLIYGISHEDSLLVALLVRFSSKSKIADEVLQRYRDLLPPKSEIDHLHAIIYITKLLLSDYAPKSNFHFAYRDNRLEIRIYNPALFQMVIEKFQPLEHLEIELIPEFEDDK